MDTDKQNATNATSMLERGLELARSGDLDTAKHVWEGALAMQPSCSVEAILCRNLAIIYLQPFRDMEDDTVLSREQWQQFLTGERRLFRLIELRMNDSLAELDDEQRQDLDDIAGDCYGVTVKASNGSWILPGDESARRALAFGLRLQGNKDKEQALTHLRRALALLDVTRNDHLEMILDAAANAAVIAAELGYVDLALNIARTVTTTCPRMEGDRRWGVLDTFVVCGVPTIDRHAVVYKYRDPRAEELAKRALFIMMDNEAPGGELDYATPIMLYREVLRIEPECTDSYLFALLGEALCKVGQFREARKALEVALANDAKFHHAIDGNKELGVMIQRNLDAIHQAGS